VRWLPWPGCLRSVHRSPIRRVAVAGVSAVVATLLAACGSGSPAASSSPTVAGSELAMGLEAPDFSLIDQFGHLRRLSEFRGKVVLLTFVSTKCTDICPLTAELMRRTQDLLGTRSQDVQLLAVNTNYRYTSVQDVLRWSRSHSMTHRWLFLTELFGTLGSVWQAYGVTGGNAHTTIVFLIDPQGRLRSSVPIAMRQGLDAEARSLAQYVTGLDQA